jgi:hypothetical protein
MPGNQDANIKLLYVVDENSFFTADTVANGAAFDVIANVEVGKDLMEVVSKEDLFVSVVNLSQSTVLQQQSLQNVLTPVANPDPLNQELRVKVSGGWTAAEGDVIEAIATYKVTAGVYTDYSSARSGTVVVSA